MGDKLTQQNNPCFQHAQYSINLNLNLLKLAKMSTYLKIDSQVT